MHGKYIAMWSGPRNISTAMMRSWGNRADTFVVDEPLYAHYLQATNYDHPGADEVIATYETDWRKVIDRLIGEIPEGKTIFYQKHMTHHMLDDMELSWILNMTNCFLLREPRRMILSFAKVIPNPQLDQMGISQQIKIFDYVREKTGKIPPVIDTKDVLINPRRTLSRLCEAIDIAFDERMLEWATGSRPTDGIWAKYWYHSVENSTSFMPYEDDNRPVPAHLENLLDECDKLYEQMSVYCIR